MTNFKVGALVLLTIVKCYLIVIRGLAKLEPNWTGLYTIQEVIKKKKTFKLCSLTRTKYKKNSI